MRAQAMMFGLCDADEWPVGHAKAIKDFGVDPQQCPRAQDFPVCDSARER